MTRTISLITATVGAALLFAVPAWGDNRGADKAQPSGVPELVDLLAAKNGTVDSSIGVNTSPTERMLARERGFGIVETQKLRSLDARERSLATKQVVQPAPDWFERAAAAATGDYRAFVLEDPFTVDPAATRDYRAFVVEDPFTVGPTAAPSVATVSSGRGVELPQIGIGLGIGLLLALGLYLAMRFTRIRPVAH